MLQVLNWHSLENRRTDAQFVMMYKISNENVAIAEEDRYKPPFDTIREHAFIVFHYPSL